VIVFWRIYPFGLSHDGDSPRKRVLHYSPCNGDVSIVWVKEFRPSTRLSRMKVFSHPRWNRRKNHRKTRTILTQ